MAAAVNQDFLTAAGDDVYPVFTVRDGNGVAIDISTVSEIVWYAQITSQDAAPLITLRKSTGGIVFNPDGVNGQFQVNIGKAFTAPLDGWYQHWAAITDALGNVTTIEIGRMKVGLKPSWTYDQAKIATVPLFQVRRLLGDVINNDQKLQDQEILFHLANRGGFIYAAAADCALDLAMQYANQVDRSSQTGLSERNSQRTAQYQKMAATLEARSIRNGEGVTVYFGGISQVDKQAVVANTDRVSPQFNIGFMDNNLLPVSQVGNLTPSSPPQGMPSL